ncbi:MAG: hypothetical protein VKJ24_05215 [Synechococcales bacterium]|nr:hypothetical protein [Synechococcales bacterium]
MSISSSSYRNDNLPDAAMWESLKQAISQSSGFQRWKLERSADQRSPEVTLDFLVHLYLRETLETLAY